MPKIGTGTNKVGIDPKAYAARITRAKKIVASMDPATKAKIKDMYPKVTREEVAKQALDTKKVAMKKKTSPMKPTVSRAPSRGVRTPMPKIQGTKPSVRTPMSKTVKKAPAKPAPLETKRVGGIFNVPKKPKKTIY